jgi:D-serine dehydratase
VSGCEHQETFKWQEEDVASALDPKCHFIDDETPSIILRYRLSNAPRQLRQQESRRRKPSLFVYFPRIGGAPWVTYGLKQNLVQRHCIFVEPAVACCLGGKGLHDGISVQDMLRKNGMAAGGRKTFEN